MNVYRHRRLDTNEVFYVGIGSRHRAHSKGNRNLFWKYVTIKTKHVVEIIAENLTKDEVCELEEFLIEEYGRRGLKNGCLVNMTRGGDGAMIGEDNPMYGLKRKDHPSHGYKHTELAKERMSESKSGEGNPNYGKSISKKTKRKMSESHKGKIKNEEWKRKIGESAGGFIWKYKNIES